MRRGDKPRLSLIQREISAFTGGDEAYILNLLFPSEEVGPDFAAFNITLAQP